MILISRQDAKTAGLKRFYTGQPCRFGHVAERSVANRGCLVCRGEKARLFSKNNREKCEARRRAYSAKNPGKLSAQKQAWSEKNREKLRAAKNAWNAKPEAKAAQKARSRKHHESNRDKTNAAHAAWAARNKGKVAALAAKYRSDKLNQTPPWADLEAIDAVYIEAGALRKQGYPATVDHVIPLRGEAVSGLHVASNLQIIHDLDNKRKSNRFHAQI